MGLFYTPDRLFAMVFAFLSDEEKSALAKDNTDIH